MRVLFCTDGSKISYGALKNFSKWVKHDETIVDIICVIDWSFLPDNTIIEESGFVTSCRNNADCILKNAEAEINSLGLNTGEKIKHCGAAVESILEKLGEKKYDAVILGSHGKKGIQIWLGSVSREVMEAVEIPAFISKHENTGKNILFTTDGTDISFDTAEKAIKMLDLSDKNIYICTVEENPDLLFLEGTLDANWMMAIRTQQQIYSDSAIKTLLALFEKNNIPVKQTQILEGVPAKGIINFAGEKEIDLVILGAKTKTKMRSFLLDSVSKRVVENVKSDAFVFR